MLGNANSNATGFNFYLAAGKYTPAAANGSRDATFTLHQGVKLYGGFASDSSGTISNLEAALNARSSDNKTILSGDLNGNDVPVTTSGSTLTIDAASRADNVYHVVTGGTGATTDTLMDGLTITGGYAQAVDWQDHKGRGAGMYNNNSSPTLNNLTFIHNMGTGWGAGMYNTGTSGPKINNATFAYNKGEAGVAMFNNGGGTNPTVTNSTFYGNWGSTNGGAVHEAEGSGGSYNHVTFANNHADRWGAAMQGNTANNTITNSLFWGNTSNGDNNKQLDASASVTYSVIEGGNNSTYSGTGNVFTDPHLGTLADNGGLTQTVAIGVGGESSALGKGETVVGITTDQRGVLRSSTPSIGAFELYDFNLAGNFTYGDLTTKQAINFVAPENAVHSTTNATIDNGNFAVTNDSGPKLNVSSKIDAGSHTTPLMAITYTTNGGKISTTTRKTMQVTVGKANITAITGITANNKTYDGTTTATLNTGSATISGIISGDNLTVDSAAGAFDNKNAGTGKTVNITGISLGGTDKDNYSVPSNVTTTAKITPASLTITAKPKTITYGDAPANDGVSYSAFVTGESENTSGVFTGTLGYDYNYSQYKDVGNNYTITPKDLTSTNYAITFAPGTLTVNQKEVGLTWGNYSNLTYDGTQKTVTATATGMVNNDAAPSLTLTGHQQTNAGSYTAQATALSGDKAANYQLPSGASQAWAIGKANLTSLVATRPYDGTTKVAGSHFTEIKGIGNELLTITGTGDSSNLTSKDASSNAVSLAQLTGLHLGDGLGGKVSNYQWGDALDSSTLATISRIRITPAPLTLTAQDQSKYQGRPFLFAGDEFTATGLINGENIASALLHTAGAAAPAPTGPYAITFQSLTPGKGFKASNYDIRYRNGQLTVQLLPHLVDGSFQQAIQSAIQRPTQTQPPANPPTTSANPGSTAQTAEGAPAGAAEGTPARARLAIRSLTELLQATPPGEAQTQTFLTECGSTLTITQAPPRFSLDGIKIIADDEDELEKWQRRSGVKTQ